MNNMFNNRASGLEQISNQRDFFVSSIIHESIIIVEEGGDPKTLKKNNDIQLQLQMQSQLSTKSMISLMPPELMTKQGIFSTKSPVKPTISFCANRIFQYYVLQKSMNTIISQGIYA
jgi:hypothetical protein